MMLFFRQNSCFYSRKGTVMSLTLHSDDQRQLELLNNLILDMMNETFEAMMIG